MISLIIKSYLAILLPLGIICILLFVIGLYLIFKKRPSQPNPKALLNDMSAIAGDDIFTTQLDLARAYIEANNLESAKKILKMIKKQGSKPQRQEAKQLLGLL